MHSISGEMEQRKGQNATSGFWSGFAASGFSVGTKGYGNFVSRTAIMATVSGTVSEATGGKFANGAMTGAFQHMFNDEAQAFTQTQAYSKDSFIKANVQLNQNKVDAFFGKALMFFAGGGAAGSAAKFGYGYAARNPEVVVFAETVVDMIYGGLSPEPPTTPTQAVGAGIYRMVE